MEFLHIINLLTVLMFVHGAYGQTLTGPDPSTVPQGNNSTFTCTVTVGSTTQLVWIDGSVSPTLTIFSGGNRFSNDPKYTNFELTSETTTTSEMTIKNTAVEDEGLYACSTPDGASGNIDLIVEVRSSRSLTLSSMDTNNEDMYVATCEATGGKPIETISWTLNGVGQSDGNGNSIVNTNPAATAPYSNTKSVFTFPANVGNYEQPLICDITGHITLTELNGQESQDLNIHTSPNTTNTMVTVGWVTQESGITVSCTADNQPSPAMRNYYIYSNDTLIQESTEGDSDVIVSNPEAGTQYTCMAGNYLGNTSMSAPDTYDPTRTTTPTPTTEPSTTEGPTTGPPESTEPVVGPSAGPRTGDGGLTAGAIAGIAVGAILVIIIIIVLIIVFVLKPDCVKGLGSSSGGGSSKKHGSSSVGSSNGNEKDKFKPTPTPRQSSMVLHTNENPGHAEYAMVDRKPKPGSGGDMPDTRGNGAGQNEPPGMLYADLDLTAKAGHTEREVPQNQENVVVYSSILV